jgi:hypothetical protein
MTKVLRTREGFWRRLRLYFSMICIFRHLVLFLLWRLVIMIFLPFSFFFLVYFLCI